MKTTEISLADTRRRYPHLLAALCQSRCMSIGEATATLNAHQNFRRTGNPAWHFATCEAASHQGWTATRNIEAALEWRGWMTANPRFRALYHEQVGHSLARLRADRRDAFGRPAAALLAA